MRSHWSLLFHKLQKPTLSTSLCWKGAPTLWAPLWTHSNGPVSSVLGAPGLDAILQVGPHVGRAEGTITSLALLAIPLSAVQSWSLLSHYCHNSQRTHLPEAALFPREVQVLVWQSPDVLSRPSAEQETDRIKILMPTVSKGRADQTVKQLSKLRGGPCLLFITMWFLHAFL